MAEGEMNSDQTGTSQSYAHSAPSGLALYLGPRDQAIRTPRSFFAALDLEYRFTLDGASSDENALVPRHSTKEAPLPWDGERVFCNPPWANVGPFLELAPVAALAVFLVPARVNSRWFHRGLALGGRPRFFQGRVRFTPNPGNRPNDSGFDCLLLVFGDPTCQSKAPHAEPVLRALEIHKKNGHPKGYEGPCWGSTPAELEQARQEAKRG